jgi:hypothetical protein
MMRPFALLLPLALTLALAGCVSKATAKAQAQAAFMQGQAQGMAMAMRQAHGADITVNGPVRNSLVPWTEDLTLANVLVAAGYMGRKDPSSIVIVRNGAAMTIDPKDLLAGHDVPMQPGDVVQISP